MCGICGVFAPPGGADAAAVAAMAASLHHRGPDDGDVWTDPASGIGFGHRRLSILDLSPLGRQPMHSACGRFVITYNGEVYNHLDLRRELGDYPFKSTSDTETILAAIGEWGLEAAVGRFVGMFAFALWDTRERCLTLVRDRLGIKPLYYGRADGALVFGSELKALRAWPGFSPAIDRGALCLYFRHGYIPAPHSIYEGVHKLKPGAMARFSGHAATPELSAYWSARDVWREGLAHPFQGGMEEAADGLEAVLSDAVSRRMLSDVPLGAFLSGGIDSSTVVALMQARSASKVKTFSIGFHEAGFDEAGHARQVAAHLGTDHTELYLTPQDLLDVVPLIPQYWDEPFADSSQIPTYCVSRLARTRVTVSLSGDGGDELFAGYSRYFLMDRLRRLLSVPGAIRHPLGRVLEAMPPALMRGLGGFGDRVRRRADLLRMDTLWDLYRNVVSTLRTPEALVLGAAEPGSELTDPANRITGEPFGLMTLLDTVSYLPDDILTKVDRASMAVALEARVPILDHRVVEFAASLPVGLKVQGGVGKAVLRKVLLRHVPAALVERPKMGFGVPIQRWMRNELRDWCESLLAPARIRSQGYLDPDRVAAMWRGYLEGGDHYNYPLWHVLMFQSWLESGGGA